jgi:hypothetical protein
MFVGVRDVQGSTNAAKPVRGARGISNESGDAYPNLRLNRSNNDPLGF